MGKAGEFDGVHAAREPVPSREYGPTAIVAAFLVGLVLGEWIVESSQLRRCDAFRTAEPVDPMPYPRALRTAPGIGRRRSLDISRFVQEHGLGADLEVLPGVGETTAASARDVLARFR